MKEVGPSGVATHGSFTALPSVDVEPILNRTVDLSHDQDVTEPNLFRFAPAEMSRRQLRFWLQNAVSRNSAALERVLTLDIDGPLDVPRFVDAWFATFQATPALRVTLADTDDNPSITISPIVYEPEVIDDLDPLAWDRDAAGKIGAPLALEQRAYSGLLYVAPDRARLVLRVHSIAADLWSFRAIAERIARAYRGRTLHTDTRFDAFLERERAYRGTHQAELDARYWAQRLDAPRAPPEYYGHRATHDRVASFRRAVSMPGDVEALRRFSEQTYRPFGLERTLRALPALATATIAYLARITGDRSVGLAVPIDMRDEDGVGPMTELCPLFVRVEDDDTFTTLMERVVEELATAAPRARNSIDNRFGKLAYDAVVDVVDLRFDRFDDAMVRARIETAPVAQVRVPAETRRDFASFSVQFGRHRGGAISIQFELAADAFPESVAADVPDHFTAILSAMVDAPATPIFAVELMSASRRAEHAPRVRPVRPIACTPDVILANARTRPGATALVARDACLDYTTIVERASTLAARLRTLGVGAEDRVAVCLPRDPDLLVALLATHLAGAAFVPLDASHPARRTSMILEDAAPAVLLTRSRFVDRFVPPSGTQVVCLDGALPPKAEGFVTAPTRPDRLAYVLYTSGSTGRPKGVAIEHGAFAHLLHSMAELIPIGADDRVLALTTPTFDIAMLELFGPLYVGGTVVLTDEAASSEPPLLASWIDRHRVTIAQATPTTWRVLVDSGWAGDARLKILSGGEALPSDLAAALLTRCGALWNVYGPTETTIWSSARRVTREDTAGTIPVGRPLGSTELYVIGRAGPLEPDGVAGELCIAGAGLARGYFGRDDLTAKAFVTHPFDPTQRIYRTGDVARRRPDGEFVCLGRSDAQVKVRGHRIELEEIEVALRQHDDVRDVAVVVETSREDERLMAYVVPRHGAAPQDPELRAFLSGALPGFMIPAKCVVVASLPTTPNGKVDRRALAALSPSVPRARQTVRPRNDLELQIVDVWRQVLGTDDISIDDAFFDLGGHSLHAVSMLSILRETLGAPVPVAEFFRRPCVAALAEIVEARAARRHHASVIALAGEGERTPLFCVCGLQLYQDLAVALGHDREVYGVLSPAEIDFLAEADPDGLPDVATLAAQYVEAIQDARPDGPYAVAGVSFGGLLAFETARQLRARGAEVTSVVLLDATLDRAIRGGARRWVANRVPGVLRRGRRAVRWDVDGISALEALRSHAYDEQALAYERRLPTYDGDVVVVRARERIVGYEVDPDLGWTRYVGGRTDVYEVPGTHLGILAEPNATVLARTIEPHLDPRAR